MNLKRIYSLKGRSLFKEVYNRGSRLQEKGIRVYFLRCSENAKPGESVNKSYLITKAIKIGISINRKFGNACERNRAKRRTRAVCFELLKEMNKGFCIIISLNENIKEADFEIQKKIIKTLFKKAGIIQ